MREDKPLPMTAAFLRDVQDKLVTIDYVNTNGMQREVLRDAALALICGTLAQIVDEKK